MIRTWKPANAMPMSFISGKNLYHIDFIDLFFKGEKDQGVSGDSIVLLNNNQFTSHSLKLQKHRQAHCFIFATFLLQA